MTTELTVQNSGDILAMALPDKATLVRELTAIKEFQALVHANLVVDLDYGVIPGTSRPTLLKPGAEKISKLLGLADHYEVLDQIEDWNKPLFHYKIKCSLISIRTGTIISNGLGECNSMEAKYRWRDSKRKCPQCGTEAIIKGKEEYGGGWLCFKKQGGCGANFPDNDPQITDQKAGRVENDDIFSQVNTILKMAKKRAMVDAALSAGRLSDIFTQDVEDLADNGVIKTEKTETIKHKATFTETPPDYENTKPVTAEDRDHYCTIHNTPFFKKGKMKAFAHPIGDTGEWCHQHTTEATEASLPTKVDKDTIPVENTSETPPVTESGTKDESLVTNDNLLELEALLKKANLTQAELAKYTNGVMKWGIKKWPELKIWQYQDIKIYLQKASGKT